ncbi:MAG: right-handed parallel beta-helix repeat-containing protein [Armatimonadetes bacterium]|nr:right-handed parallel beta-helix repeat-containing protein [Armatimonadota bacterium]
MVTRPIWALFGLLISQVALADITVYVAPDGNDRWTGARSRTNAARSDGPVRSLLGARDAVRKLRSANGAAEPVTVLIAPGTYSVRAPLVLEPRDGGSKEAPVLYRSTVAGKAVFDGGSRITGWKPGRGGVWSAPLPRLGSAAWLPEQLFVNGRRAVRARTPNTFWSYAAAKTDSSRDPDTGAETDLSRRAFRAHAKDLASLRKLPADRLRQAVVVAYHSWETSRHYVAGLEGDNLIVKGPGAPWPFLYWGPNQRYHIENVREALDQPGEWFAEDGLAHYLPRQGEDMRKAEVYGPVCEQFVRFEGTADRPVQHITLRGRPFRHGAYTMPPDGHADGQAEFSIPAVVMADHVREVHLDRCEIGHVGMYGVWFRRGCTDCSLTRSHLYDLGAGGARIGEGEIRPEGPDRTTRVTVDNNIIRTGGRLHGGAIGVWVGQSGGNRITHNDISDLYYTGVSVGWTWGYGPALALGNRVDNNHIHHLGWGVLSDMGGVYTLGNHEGTTVNGNHIHHVYSYDRYGRGGWGLYNDEGTTRIVMRDNYVHHVSTGTYHQHYGKDNQIVNNVLAFSKDGQIQRSRPEAHRSFTFAQNVVVWDDGDPLSGTWTDPNVVSERNLFWRFGQPVLFAGKPLSEWQATGKEAGSLVADPLFTDIRKGDLRLRPGSPVAKIGFQPFDPSRAGVYGDKAWVKLARSVVYPSVRFAPPPPPPPPLRLSLDFERVPVGGACPDAQTLIEGKGDAIAVTDTTALSGSRSLRLQDAPGLQHAYNPHLVFAPNYTSGIARCSFAIRLDANAVLHYEWRDWREQPYKVGPSLWIRQGKLEVAGRELCAVPADTWVQLTTEAHIGSQQARTWTLNVAVPGSAPRVFDDLPCGSPDFLHFTWLGFCSVAVEASSIYLDDIAIANR